MRYLRSIYFTAIDRGRQCIVDLSRVKTIAVGPALALSAELQRCNELAPGRVQGVRPIDPVARHVLEQVGFFEVTDNPDFTADHPVSAIMKMRTGLTADIQRTEHLDRFLRSMLPEGSLSEQIIGRVKGAITEALLNVVDHAYPDEVARGDICPSRRYWMCGVADAQRGTFAVMVYDLGVGIPATVPRSEARGVRSYVEQLGWNDRRSDAKLIEAAVKAPRSRTGVQGRGRGLPEMRRLIDRAGEGSLWITSGRGQYLYSKGAAPNEFGMLEPEALRGTLVAWQLKLIDGTDILDGSDGGADAV
jgi:anti-sigma regulatory factor (Ser/Thr protein kinase)